jgi:uncharacterized protein YbjT (DUF2867 family)
MSVTPAIFVVIGATRGVGLQVVKRLLELPASTVFEVRPVVRQHSVFPKDVQDSDSRVKVFAGDCGDVDSLRAAMKDAKVVFYCASSSVRGVQGYKAVDSEGVKNAAAAALEEHVERMVLVTSQVVHPDNFWNPVRMFLNAVMTGLMSPSGMDLKYEGEQYLRRSGLPYTIVRPGHLLDKPLHYCKPLIAQTNGILRGTSTHGIGRADVAAVVVAAGLSDHCKNVTFELGADSPPAGSSEAPAIDSVQLFKDLSSAWDEKFLKEPTK